MDNFHQLDELSVRSERNAALDAVTRVSVRAGEHEYDAVVGTDVVGQFRNLLPVALARRRAAVICDANTRGIAERLSALLGESSVVVVAPGERSKSLEQVGAICEQMARAGLDRSSFVIGVGGGVVGDLSGFVAAVFHRGIPHVQVPTTLLAMVDSSIGGKTGVNTSVGKNLIGAIHHPSLVLADIETLQTLPQRELRQGFAEIIKHGVIADAPMLDEVRNFNRANLGPLIARNIRIKAAFVATDDRDVSGKRAVLNFGHTIGHAIERAAGYGELLHGEAVSLGMIAACNISMKRAGLASSSRDKIVALLEAFDLPTRLPEGISRERIFESVIADKKFERGEVRFVVTPELGHAHLTSDVTLDDIRGAIAEL